MPVHHSVSSPHAAGSYASCGITTCGSLGLSGSPIQHGECLTLTQSELEMKLPTFSSKVAAADVENDRRNELYLLEVSRLEAKKRISREKQTKNKASHGSTDKSLFELNTLSITTAGSDLSIDANEASYSPSVSFLSDEDMQQFGITRVSSAASPSKASARGLKGNTTGPSLSRASTAASDPSGTKFSSFKKGNRTPMRSIDLKDVPELKFTRPLMASPKKTVSLADTEK